VAHHPPKSKYLVRCCIRVKTGQIVLSCALTNNSTNFVLYSEKKIIQSLVSMHGFQKQLLYSAVLILSHSKRSATTAPHFLGVRHFFC
jgi:cytidine deaminase